MNDDTDLYVARLAASHTDLALQMFTLMAEVFDEELEPLSETYLADLLDSPAFWAFVAVDGGDVAGGLTAHTLPMTTSERAEVFLYDLAVHPEHRRRGIGRLLIRELVDAAARAGIDTVFVPVDNEDSDALEFYRSLGASASAVTLFDLGSD